MIRVSWGNEILVFISKLFLDRSSFNNTTSSYRSYIKSHLVYNELKWHFIPLKDTDIFEMR